MRYVRRLRLLLNSHTVESKQVRAFCGSRLRKPYEPRRSDCKAKSYERRNILLTANQTFSGWDTVLRAPGNTAVAIDRMIHL